MDAGPFFALSAWAPFTTHATDRCQTTKQSQSAIPLPAPASCKTPSSAWKVASKPVTVCPTTRAVCMRGPRQVSSSPDAAKSVTICHAAEAKANSIDIVSGLETGVGSGGPGCFGLPVATRLGHGSTPQLPAPARELADVPTVAEVLRTAKLLLAPTTPVERQFYADCYRACQVMPANRPVGAAPPPNALPHGAPPAPTLPSPHSAAAPPQSQPPPPPLPYISHMPEVALRLSCLGHRVVLRRVTDTKHYWSKSMTNTFCYVVLPGTGIGYVLDPNFKEHFRAACMSNRYRDIWECLPPLFVGPPAKLVQLVQTLCAELTASFEGAGRQLPPWRSFNATINRWMSPAFRDLPVPPRRMLAGGGAAGAAASSGGGPGMIPALEAHAFLEACDELLACTASARPSQEQADPRVAPTRGSRPGTGPVAGASGGPAAATPAHATARVGPGGFAGVAGQAPARAMDQGPQPPQQQQQQLDPQRCQHLERRRSHGGGSEPIVRRPRQTQTGFAPPVAAMGASGIREAAPGVSSVPAILVTATVTALRGAASGPSDVRVGLAGSSGNTPHTGPPHLAAARAAGGCHTVEVGPLAPHARLPEGLLSKSLQQRPPAAPRQ